MSHKSKGDVQYYVPKRKTPIAYGTIATSELIALLATQHETIKDVHNAITYDEEAKLILQIYIDKGYGNEIAKEWFR